VLVSEERVQSDERRQRLLDILSTAAKPVAGTELGSRLGATRQTVVQDIAILRARGEPIVATARGYMLASALTPDRHRAVLAVRHGPEELEDELSALLDLGLRIIDVGVDHPVYGEIRGMLMLDSREDLREWLQTMRERQAHLLSELTDGVHLHTVEAPRPELIEKAREALRRKGYLFEE
jgi:transcriptional regulator of NAD metabolism